MFVLWNVCFHDNTAKEEYFAQHATELEYNGEEGIGQKCQQSLSMLVMY